MINITLNLPDEIEFCFEGLKGGLQEAFDAARVLYPEWTSMVLVVTNTKAKRGEA